MQNTSRSDWSQPLALLALCAIPCAAGLVRLAGLAQLTTPDGNSARFLAAPISTSLHIVGASLFCLLGAFQFSAGLRQRHARWHQRAGRVVAVSGIVAALSGMWMTATFAIPPALQGGLLYGVRLLVGAAMAASIVLAVRCALRRELARHRVWMVRAYALGLGAGTQVVLLLPWMLLVGPPSALQRDVLMALAWLLNLFLAEWALRPCGSPRTPLRTALSL